MNIEPLFEKLDSGVELFEETKANITVREAMRLSMPPKTRKRLMRQVRRNTNQPLLDVFWGNDFGSL